FVRHGRKLLSLDLPLFRAGAARRGGPLYSRGGVAQRAKAEKCGEGGGSCRFGRRIRSLRCARHIRGARVWRRAAWDGTIAASKLLVLGRVAGFVDGFVLLGDRNLILAIEPP